MNLTIEQEKVFKFLWPDKCYHEPHTYDEDMKCGCLHCDEVIHYEELANPDFSTPDGMVMVLDRLVEMGYRCGIIFPLSLFKNNGAECSLTALGEETILGYADTAPLAVLAAVNQLMEKESK